jgi:hypothetical protein
MTSSTCCGDGMGSNHEIKNANTNFCRKTQWTSDAAFRTSYFMFETVISEDFGYTFR